MATKSTTSTPVGVARGDEALAKNFEFSILSSWQGYNSANDKTNVPENVMVQGSQNIYKKLSGNLAVRPGLLRIGVTNNAFSPVSSEFVWYTSWGATYPIWVSNGLLQVSINNLWYTLATTTKTRYVFDKWYDATLSQDKCVFVSGDGNVQYWAGGSGTILSTTATTITITGTPTWTQSFFLPSPNSIVINGNTYTYTGGEGTTTLTGVSPSPVGEANGSVVLQSVTTFTPSPGLVSNDFCKVINQQLYLGSYTSRLLYVSSSTDITNFTVPNPILTGSPQLFTLDNTLNGIAVKDGNPFISVGMSEWIELVPNQISNNNVIVEATTVTPFPVANQAAALAHEFISNSGNNIIYLSKDHQLRELGNFNNLFVTGYPALSQQIWTELQTENFTGGGVRCIGDFTYITAPNSGKTYLYQVRQTVVDNTVVNERLWHSPFIWNATRIDEINGTVVVFSNANPQVYQAWDTNQWHDDAPSGQPLPYNCVLALSYRTGDRRQGLQSFDKTFAEGYLSSGTPLNLTVNYDYEGATNVANAIINSITQPAYLFQPPQNSLGDNSLGDKPLGQGIVDQTVSTDLVNMAKFKEITSLGQINCFEYQPIISSDSADAQWEILAFGTNAKIVTTQQPTFIINKPR